MKTMKLSMSNHQLSMMLCLLLAGLTWGACNDDDGHGSGKTQTFFTANNVNNAPSWQVDWMGNDARPDWTEPDPSYFENWGVMLIQIEETLKPYASEDDLLAVFVDNEMRGMSGPAINVSGNGNGVNGTFLLKPYGNESDKMPMNVDICYYCSQLKQTFTFSTQSQAKIGDVFGINEDFIPQFTHGSTKYPVVMDLNVAVTSLELSDIQPAVGDMLGAFVNDECRGTYTLDDNLFSVPVTMTVFGRMAGETVTLKYYHAATQRVLTFHNTFKVIAGFQTVNM